MTRQTAGYWLLDHFVAVVTSSLTRAGVEARTASKAAFAAAADLQSTYGGRQFYIPKGQVQADARATEVYLMRDSGKSVREIAQHFSYSEMWVYALLKREKLLIEAQARKDAGR